MLQRSDVLGMFEFSAPSADTDVSQSWVRNTSGIDLNDRSSRRYHVHYLTWNPMTGGDRNWGSAFGTAQNWIRVAQDGVNALVSYFPFSSGLVQPTGVYDCPTAALTTIARHWYRRDLPIPLPTVTPLEWPEFVLFVQASPAMADALSYTWNNPTLTYQEPLGSPAYRWVLPDPSTLVPATPPSSCGQWSSSLKGLSETPMVFPQAPEVPDVVQQQIPTLSVSAESQPESKATGIHPAWLVLGVGLGALGLAWALKE